MSVCVEDITASIFSCALVFWPKYLIYSHSLWHTENVSVWTGHFAWTLTPKITSFYALFADSEVTLWKISAAYLYGLAQKHVAASDWKSGCCYCTSPWPVPWGERRDKQLNKCCVSRFLCWPCSGRSWGWATPTKMTISVFSSWMAITLSISRFLHERADPSVVSQSHIWDERGASWQCFTDGAGYIVQLHTISNYISFRYIRYWLARGGLDFETDAD